MDLFCSFIDVVNLLKSEKCVHVTKELLQNIHLHAMFRHGNPSRTKAVNVKIILASYMIRYHTDQVFETVGYFETNLLQASVALLDCFDRICNAIHTSNSHRFQDVPHDTTSGFVNLLESYLQSFTAWKKPDEAKLMSRIQHALTALYKAKAQLPPDEPADSTLSNEFRVQISNLRKKLSVIGGEAALSAFDATLPQSINAVVQPPVRDSIFRGRMTNEEMAHELLIDSAFQLPDNFVADPAQGAIRETFHRCFWQSLVDDLKLEVPAYSRLLRVIQEIHDGILDFVGAENNMVRSIIMQCLDTKKIEQQFIRGEFNWEQRKLLITYTAGMFQIPESPNRYDQAEETWNEMRKKMDEASREEEEVVFCDALEYLLNRLNALRTDAANKRFDTFLFYCFVLALTLYASRLRLVSQVIQVHGLDYEKKKFEDKLKSGELTLERTEVS